MNRELLRTGARTLGLELGETELACFELYERLLQQWGERINLTAIHDSDAIVRGHFLDSLALVSALGDTASGASMVDVGSGAGFPGMVCALLWPALRLTLVERVQKKAAFLLTLRRELGLRVEVVPQDVRTLARRFEIVVSRAAFPPDTWLQVGDGLVAEEGLLVWMVSAKQQLPALPPTYRLEASRPYDLGEGAREVVLWRKKACG